MNNNILLKIFQKISYLLRTKLPSPWDFCKLKLERNTRLLVNSGSYFLVYAAFVFWFTKLIVKLFAYPNGTRQVQKDWCIALVLSFTTAMKVLWPVLLVSTHLITCSFYPWVSALLVLFLNLPSLPSSVLSLTIKKSTEILESVGISKTVHHEELDIEISGEHLDYAFTAAQVSDLEILRTKELTASSEKLPYYYVNGKRPSIDTTGSRFYSSSAEIANLAKPRTEDLSVSDQAISRSKELTASAVNLPYYYGNDKRPSIDNTGSRFYSSSAEIANLATSRTEDLSVSEAALPSHFMTRKSHSFETIGESLYSSNAETSDLEIPRSVDLSASAETLPYHLVSRKSHSVKTIETIESSFKSSTAQKFSRVSKDKHKQLGVSSFSRIPLSSSKESQSISHESLESSSSDLQHSNGLKQSWSTENFATQLTKTGYHQYRSDIYGDRLKSFGYVSPTHAELEKSKCLDDDAIQFTKQQYRQIISKADDNNLQSMRYGVSKSSKSDQSISEDLEAISESHIQQRVAPAADVQSSKFRKSIFREKHATQKTGSEDRQLAADDSAGHLKATSYDISKSKQISKSKPSVSNADEVKLAKHQQIKQIRSSDKQKTKSTDYTLRKSEKAIDSRRSKREVDKLIATSHLRDTSDGLRFQAYDFHERIQKSTVRWKQNQEMEEVKVAKERDTLLSRRKTSSKSIEMDDKKGYCGRCGKNDYLPFRPGFTELRKPYDTRTGLIYGPTRRFLKLFDFMKEYALK